MNANSNSTQTQTVQEIQKSGEVNMNANNTANQTEQCNQLENRLDDWRNEVAVFANDNPLITLAICAGFAAPLLKALEKDNFGFHFHGASGTGKTTLLNIACSVAGESKHSWRATANALEVVAGAHDGHLLCLDEMHEIDSEGLRHAVYRLTNGKGKQGTDNIPAKWSTLLLSAGELPVNAVLDREGLEPRLIDIPVNAKDGAFNDYLNQASREFGGTAFTEFSLRLDDYIDYAEAYEAVFYSVFWKSPDLERSYLDRIAKNFAIVAAAGELASLLGVTGWPFGMAIKHVGECFKTCLENFDNQEAANALYDDMSGRNDFQLTVQANTQSLVEIATDINELCQDYQAIRQCNDLGVTRSMLFSLKQTINDIEELLNAMPAQNAANGGAV